PHGPVCFAAALPSDIEVEFIDENVDTLKIQNDCDLVCISMMLTAQITRGWEIADEYRRIGKKVIFGGISAMLHAKETMEHADSIFLGEAEGRMEEVLADFKNNSLKKAYNYLHVFPDINTIGPAKRSILKDELYYYKGIRMVDLFHASRGCRFSCYPCAVSYLGGRNFRPRPMHRIEEELALIKTNRLFVVDNSLAQDTEWEKELFRTMIPFKKNWCCHTIEDDEEVLKLAAAAGAWYVYQAVFDTSDYIKERIKRYHDHGIGVEGTILLGLDNQTEDDIKKLVDFLLEINLDLAEFTVFTPFPHTKAYDDLLREKRIIDWDYRKWNAGNTIIQPKNMSAEKLQELFNYAWDTFYKDENQNFKMFKLINKIVEKEKKAGTFQPRKRELMNARFGTNA
ncbi:MAG: radical SAM protein, partial [Spirochaetes bacterium GWF1_41_5]